MRAAVTTHNSGSSSSETDGFRPYGLRVGSLSSAQDIVKYAILVVEHRAQCIPKTTAASCPKLLSYAVPLSFRNRVEFTLLIKTAHRLVLSTRDRRSQTIPLAYDYLLPHPILHIADSTKRKHPLPAIQVDTQLFLTSRLLRQLKTVTNDADT